MRDHLADVRALVAVHDAGRVPYVLGAWSLQIERSTRPVALEVLP